MGRDGVMGALKTREWKMWHQIAEVENWEIDNARMCDKLITD